MPARFAALGDHEVEPRRFKAFRFGDIGRAAANDHSQFLELL